MIASAYIDALQIHATSALAISRTRGLGSPVPRRESTLRPSRHGERDTTRFYAGRVIELEGLATGATQADAYAAIDALKGALALGSEHVLKFTRQGLAYAERAVIREGSALEFELVGKRKTIKWAVALVAADPRLYADTLSSGSYDPTQAGSGSGVNFPLTFPLDFGSGSSSGSLQLTNAGNFPTPPVWTITGPAVNPELRNDTTGESIFTTGLSLNAGAQIVIDVAARDVLVSGTSRPDLIDAASTIWGELAPGVNVVRLVGSGFVAAQTLLECSFRDARI